MRPPQRRGRLIPLVVRAYPRALRDRFGAEMLEDMRSRRTRARGPVPVAWFWVRMLADLARSWMTGGGTRAWGGLAGGADSLARAFASGLADLDRAMRALRRAPARTAALVLLTALTVTAATTVFAVVDAVLFRPLPYPDPDRLVAVWEQRGPATAPRNVVGAHEFPEWAGRSAAFDHLAAFMHGGAGANLTGSGEPLALTSIRVTWSFFDVFGVDLAAGRTFRPEDDQPGARPVAIISTRLWRDRFAGDRTVIGRSIRISDVPTLVVGVAPEGFDFPAGQGGRAPDAWLPIAEPIHLYRGRHYLFVVGRIRPDRTLEQARADLSSVAGAIEAEWPDENRGHGVLVERLGADLTREARPALQLVLAGVGLLALTGCVNVAGLGIAAGMARRRDLQVCLALGAGLGRIGRQLVLEAIGVGLAGGALGLIGAVWLTHLAPALLPSDVLRLGTIPFDGRVTGAALALTASAALALALSFVAQVPRRPLPLVSPRVKRGHHPRARAALVVAEIALTAALLSTAVLLVGEWRRLGAVDIGFRTDHVLAVDLALPEARYPGAVDVRRTFDAIQDLARQVPGVTAVATTSLLPLGGGRSTVALTIEGRPAPPRGQEPTASYRVVSADYFRTLGIPIVSGPGFTTAEARLAVPLIRWYPQQPEPALFDRPQPPPVAIVDESMARAYWPDSDPVGRRIKVLFSPWITIVGVAATSRTWTRQAPAAPEIYLSDQQEPQGRMNLLLGTTGHPADLRPAVHALIREVDPDLPVIAAEPLEEVTDAELGLPRLTSAVTVSFAAVALLLMAAGIYALLSFITSARRAEIGLRVALGASPASIRRIILGQSGGLLVVGLVVGNGATLPLRTFLQAQGSVEVLHGHRDPGLWVAAAIVLLATAASSYVPMRRALRIDPADALKAE